MEKTGDNGKLIVLCERKLVGLYIFEGGGGDKYLVLNCNAKYFWCGGDVYLN